MSQINPNTGASNPAATGNSPAGSAPQGNGSGNHYQRKNVSHRAPHNYNLNTPHNMYVPTDGYMGYGASPYQPTYFQGQQGYYMQHYSQAAPMYRSDYGQHAINVTTATGEKVDLTPKGAAASLNRSSASSTPKATPAQLGHQRTPSLTTSPAPQQDEKARQMKEDFLKKVRERAAKAKAAASTPETKPAEKADTTPAASPATATPATATSASTTPASTTPAPATSAPVTEEKAAPAATPVVEKEQAIRQFKESIASKASSEQTPEITKSETEAPADKKADATETEAPAEKKADVTEKAQETDIKSSTEAPVEATPAEENEAPAAAEETKASETVEEASTAQPLEQTKETPATEEKPVDEAASTATKEVPSDETKGAEVAEEKKTENADLFTVSKFLSSLQTAKAIEDPFTFTYPEGFQAPHEGLQAKGPKFRYDPPFLLSLQEKCKFPTDEDFKEKTKFIVVSNRGDRSGSSRNFKFGQGGGLSGSQGFSKSSSNMRKQFGDPNSRSNSRTSSKRRGPSGRGDRKSNRNRDRDDREREPEIPLEPVKPLEKSANRWVPKSRANKTTDEERKTAPDGTPLLTAEEAATKTRSLLNKLTLEYFEAITDKILEIANQSKYEENCETLKVVLNTTFDKATDEPHWSNMYAQFTAKMCKVIDPEVTSSDLKDRDGNPLKGGAIVRRLLLSKCQVEYEKGWSDKLPTNEDGSPLEPEMMTDEYYKAAAAKRRGLGLVRFIGHLYVLGLLSEAIIMVCLAKLSDNVEDPSEDTVENLVQLITTVGEKLDSTPQSRSKFDLLFQRVQALSEAKIPSRLQFSVMDLLDLRKAQWKGKDADKGPKTIQQIHEEEKKKHSEEQKNNDRRRSNRGDSRANSSKAGWGASRVSNSDMRRMGQVNTSASSSNLGPMNNFSKSRSLRGKSSSTNSASSPSQAPVESRENSKRPANSYAALLGGDDDEEEETNETHEAEQNEDEEQQENEGEDATEVVVDDEKEKEDDETN